MSPYVCCELDLFGRGLFSGALLGLLDVDRGEAVRAGLVLVVGQVDATHARLDIARDQLLEALIRPEVVARDREQARLAGRDVGPASTGIVVIPVHEAEGRAKRRADLAGRAGVVALAGLKRQALKVGEELDFGQRHPFWEMP
jgi:hypothetical protein